MDQGAREAALGPAVKPTGERASEKSLRKKRNRMAKWTGESKLASKLRRP